MSVWARAWAKQPIRICEKLEAYNVYIVLYTHTPHTNKYDTTKKTIAETLVALSYLMSNGENVMVAVAAAVIIIISICRIFRLYFVLLYVMG